MKDISERTRDYLVDYMWRQVAAPNPLYDRLDRWCKDREAAKWLAGDTDVSMGTSYEMTGWGQHEPA